MAARPPASPELCLLLRSAYPRVLSRVLGQLRNLNEAEDAVQDAMERALRLWQLKGVPDAPEAWLFTVATNRYKDRLRKQKRAAEHRDTLTLLAESCPYGPWTMPAAHAVWEDDLLRLLFTCADPALSLSEAAALTLSAVLGLSTAELAGAFVVKPRTMEQRLMRARRRLRERRGEYLVPNPNASHDRTTAVLRVVALLFNEGYWSHHNDAPIRRDFCQLALGLSSSLQRLWPEHPETLGLRALLLLHDARYPARLDPAGNPIPMPEQDRTLYDRDQIERASTLVEHAISLGTLGPFQIEAAIAAVHCQAEAAAATDWVQIATLYELLESLEPSPVVRVNRAFAVAQADGPNAALELLDALQGSEQMDQYCYAWLVRGKLELMRQRPEAALPNLKRALELSRNTHEHREISRLIDEARGTPRERP